MHELIPLFAGVVVGFIVAAIPGRRTRALALVVLCFIVGGAISFVMGELAAWWAFIALDALLVWVGALVAVTAAGWWRSRRAASSARR
jgi:hypothetical protein